MEYLWEGEEGELEGGGGGVWEVTLDSLLSGLSETDTPPSVAEGDGASPWSEDARDVLPNLWWCDSPHSPPL